jgi:hypothetical protein
VLVADPDARGRLRAVSALRGTTEVLIPEPGELVIRAVRRLRPDVVLVAMPRARMREALRTARTIKTDGATPARVGLMDRWRRLKDPDETLRSCLANGYLGGKADSGAIVAFTRALSDGGRPISLFEGERGLLGRLLRS